MKAVKKILPGFVLSVILVFSLQSCATIEKLENHGLGSVPYQGTVEDLEMIGRGENETVGYFLVVFGLVDLPFSFIADTLLLPANLFHWLFLEDPEKVGSSVSPHNQPLQQTRSAGS